jgi:hypothetical protein
MHFLVFAADPADVIGTLVQALTDFKGGHAVLGIALLVGMVIALAKQGWLSSWLASKLPPVSLPYLAVALAFVGTWSTEVENGTAWLQALLDALKIAAIAVLGHETVIEGLRKGKEIVPTAPWCKPGSTPKPPIAAVGLLAIVLLCLGCISSAPITPVTPANQDQVSTCQSIASLHNGVVIGDFVVGGVTSGLAGVGAALSDTQSKTDLAIAAAAAGAVGLVGTGVAGLTSADFANSNCSSVVGSLPAGKGGGQ